MAYYCTECEKEHRESSGIGKRHKEFEGEPTPIIRVRPDRSVADATSLIITGSSELGYYEPPRE